LRQRLQALQRTAGIADVASALPLGIAAIDEALGGGLARGALHEIAAPSEAHLAAATGFVLGLAARGQARAFWIAEDMALAESGAPYGPGLDAFGLAPERLLTVSAAHRCDLLWAMEEALRCRAVGAVIGELRHGALDAVAVRRLSLAAADSGTLALLLRTAPASDASTAATRWIVGAAASSPSPGGERNARFAAHLVRNRRGPAGSWILEWSDIDERFVLATPAQPVAAPALDRPHRQVA
jgi:protein ImuA